MRAVDRRGNPVDDLDVEEIIVQDRGRKLRIAFLEPFARPSDQRGAADARLFVAVPGTESRTVQSADPAPRYLILLVDVENDYRLLQPRAVEQCVRFLREGLRPGDVVAVFSYDGRLNEELMFTESPEELAPAIMRAYDTPPRPQLDTRARTQQLIDAFSDCASQTVSRTTGGHEGCARQVALDYADEMRPRAEDYLASLDSLVRWAGGLPSRATVIALSHGTVVNPADVVVEAARAAYGNSDVLAALRLEIATGEGARNEMNGMLERAVRQGVALNFVDRSPMLSADHDVRLGRPYEAGARPMQAAHEAPQRDLTEMASQTGGVFLASDDLYSALGRVSDLQNGSYRLGYYLDRWLTPKQLDRVKVKNARQGVRILPARGHFDPGAGSLTLGAPLSLAEDGRPGQFVPFTIVGDPAKLGYRIMDESFLADLTLSVRVISDDGRPLVETFHSFEHGYPADLWVAGQIEPIEFHGWTECSPGRYVIDVLLRNSRTGEQFAASRGLTVSSTDNLDPSDN